ncbi:hypothetical protein [Bradyrhizobium sp. LMG 9283]|uniref:hypothetical protein n=1 Tax=Bradyrhizobium sp. LMG 9283 TaxID=592064 RepID=UPI00388D8AA0
MNSVALTRFPQPQDQLLAELLLGWSHDTVASKIVVYANCASSMCNSIIVGKRANDCQRVDSSSAEKRFHFGHVKL